MRSRDANIDIIQPRLAEMVVKIDPEVCVSVPPNLRSGTQHIASMICADDHLFVECDCLVRDKHGRIENLIESLYVAS